MNVGFTKWTWLYVKTNAIIFGVVIIALAMGYSARNYLRMLIAVAKIEKNALTFLASESAT